jgi:hypothetical protein
MLNILQIEDRLKDMSKDSVIQALNNPNPTIPPFLALAELNRRKRMEDEMAMRKAENQPTVAEQLVAAAGMPTQETSDMAMTMAPKTDMAQNTGANQMMAREMPEETPGMSYGGVLNSRAMVMAQPLRSSPPLARPFPFRMQQQQKDNLGFKNLGSNIVNRIGEKSQGEVDEFIGEVRDMADERFDLDLNQQPQFDSGGKGFPPPMLAQSLVSSSPRPQDMYRREGGIARMSNGGELEYMGFTQRLMNRLFGSGDEEEGTVDTAQNQSMGGPDLETLYNRGFTPTQTATPTSTTTTKKNNTTTTPPPGGDNVLGSSYIAKMMKNIDKDRAELADQRRRDEAIALMTAGLNIYDRGQLSAGTEGLKSLQASNKAYRDQMAKMRGMDVQLGVAADTLAQKRQQSKDVLKAAGLKGTGLTANQAGSLALKYKNAISKMRQALEVGYITEGTNLVQLTEADKQKYKDDIVKFEKLANELTAIFEGKAISPYRLPSSILE